MLYLENNDKKRSVCVQCRCPVVGLILWYTSATAYHFFLNTFDLQFVKSADAELANRGKDCEFK